MKKLITIFLIAFLFVLLMPPQKIANASKITYSKKQLRIMAKESIKKYHMERHAIFINTLIAMESSWNPYAKDKKAACFGLLQSMISTAQMHNKNIKTEWDLYKPKIALDAGIAHIKYLIKKHPKATYEDILLAYNLGEKGYFIDGKTNPKYIQLYKDRLSEEIEYRAKR